MGTEVAVLLGVSMGLLVLVALVGSWLQRRAERLEETWRSVALQHQLQLTLDGRARRIGEWSSDVQRELKGEVDGVAVRVTVEDAPMASEKFMTYGEVLLDPPIQTRLQVRLKGLLRGGVWTVLEGPDIKTGDADFDRTYDVRGDDPARVTAALGPEVRAALMAVAAFATGVEVHKERVVWWTRAESGDPKTLSARVVATAEVGRAFAASAQGGRVFLPEGEEVEVGVDVEVGERGR